jgi:hypothetical protein
MAMLQNGRKPTRTLVAFQHPSQRLEPPADLTRNENRVWRDVVNSRPADWFDRDSAYLLINFCRHTVMARRLTNQIEASDPSDIATLEKLLRMRNAETKPLLSLATAMRISQHALKQTDVAAAQANQSTTDKPWVAAAQTA